ncbi:DUF6118 family protein [Methylocella tundrae]|nr:DUF6118 family protein [Methylocella tundrae]
MNDVAGEIGKDAQMDPVLRARAREFGVDERSSLEKALNLEERPRGRGPRLGCRCEKDKGRMTEQDDHTGDAAELAFAELRDEVAAARRAVGSLPAVIQSLMIEGLEAPDYGPSFAALAKDLAAVEKRLAGIEAHPAIKSTPEQHARAIVVAGAHSMEAAFLAFHDRAVALGEEKARAAALMQKKRGLRQLWFAAAGVAAGFVLFPLLAAFAPGGSHLAALAAGHADRWEAGGALMQAASPAVWSDLSVSWTLAQANADELKACRDLAAAAGKAQPCVVTVAAP